MNEDFSNVTFAPIDIDLMRKSSSYDLLIASVGYERRATHIFRSSGIQFAETWAIEYKDNRVLHYEKNRAAFDAVGEVWDLSDDKLTQELVDRFAAMNDEFVQAQEVLNTTRALRIAVDISCMNRDRMAAVAMAALTCAVGEIEIDFLYSPALFNENLVGSEGSVVVNRPIRGLEGWTIDPNLPVTCIIGAGFESRLAMAAIETLEPANTVWLFPHGLDPQYDEVVQKRNYESAVSVFDHVSSYDVAAPYRLLNDLLKTTDRLLTGNRVVIVPLGPKIFAIASILVGALHPFGVTVWRLSADLERVPEDRVASGPILGVKAVVSA